MTDMAAYTIITILLRIRNKGIEVGDGRGAGAC
jgi:hypothetical protein